MFDLNDINNRICDRSECFYWQTDRKISVEEASLIQKDRHSAITNEELLEIINGELVGDKLKFIEPFDINAQTSLGNVNSIRVGVLESGKKVIIRCHPKGVKNGYFYAESLASKINVCFFNSTNRTINKSRFNIAKITYKFNSCFQFFISRYFFGS